MSFRIPSSAAAHRASACLRQITCGWADRLTTKPSARARRSAEFGQRCVVGTEAGGFVRRRSAVRIPSGCAAPTGTNAARRADTKAERALRRDTKRLRVPSRTVSLRKGPFCLTCETSRSRRGARMSMKGRGERGSIFVNRRAGKPFSCRTDGARSCRFVFARSAETRRFSGFAASLCDLCVKTFANFALKTATSGRLGLTQRTRRGKRKERNSLFENKI